MFDYLKLKKIMVIVPHEDDELNCVGGMLVSNYFEPSNVYLAFVTNGDYLCNYHMRIKESMKIARKLNIPYENLIFFGYSDQHIKESSHIYNTHKPAVFISKKGNKETFCTNKINDYHYNKYKKHAQFNHESLLADFIDLITQYKPDILFTVDFDSHPDHRAVSLIFDKALGILLKKNIDYKPIVYKALTYPVNYKGIKDFNNINFLSSNFNNEPYSLSEIQNPYYLWEERVRFPVNYGNSLINNPFYNLLKNYRSQLIVKRTYSIINSDVIFWQRRTDNLCLNAKIDVSSGNSKYLNDFVLFDVDKLTNGNSELPTLKNSSWIPLDNDVDKQIKITLAEKMEIYKIVLYQNIIDHSKVKCVDIELSNGEEYNVNLDKTKTNLFIECNEKIEWVKIKILDRVGINAGFSEIEIFPTYKPLFNYMDIEILDSFSQKNIYVNNKLKDEQIKFYYYDGYESKYLKSNEILLNNSYYDLNNIMYSKNIFSLKNNKNIFKEIRILKNSNFVKLCSQLKSISNNVLLKADIFISRVLNKINRLLKRL